MFCYMFLTHKKHQKTQFLSDFVIFRNTWLFSEIFGYFLTHRYQIWLFQHKIRILQMILNYRDILNKSLGELGIKNAVLALQPTTVHWPGRPVLALVQLIRKRYYLRMITFKTNQLVNNQKQKRSVQFCLTLWEHLVNLFEVLKILKWSLHQIYYLVWR